MTREIKFRIWDKKTHKWLLTSEMVFLIRTDTNYLDLSNLRTDSPNYSDELIVSEFTNFEDNNGKDIFEGDIIRRYTYDGDIEWGYVAYSTCLGGVNLNMVLTTEEFEQFQITECPAEAFEDCEVIGNIYENPEILDLELDEWDRLN